MAKDKGRRQKVVLATKITGGSNISRESIIRDCEGSLSRLGTDYIDVYQTHWPARCAYLNPTWTLNPITDSTTGPSALPRCSSPLKTLTCPILTLSFLFEIGIALKLIGAKACKIIRQVIVI